MTELETIERAKAYIDQLANGIDPLTNLPVEEDDVINQVRISRCLFFVSDVLGKILVNGGIEETKGSKKVPFSITQEQLTQVCFSKSPLRITQLCQRITQAANAENMTQLSAAAILEWLESLGLLVKRQMEDGTQRRRPTEAGNQLGILEAQRSGIHGTYMAVLYTVEAQHFIVDNLEAALEFRKKKNQR